MSQWVRDMVFPGLYHHVVVRSNIVTICAVLTLLVAMSVLVLYVSNTLYGRWCAAVPPCHLSAPEPTLPPDHPWFVGMDQGGGPDTPYATLS
jgi:hypothetical protein